MPTPIIGPIVRGVGGDSRMACCPRCATALEIHGGLDGALILKDFLARHDHPPWVRGPR